MKIKPRLEISSTWTAQPLFDVEKIKTAAITPRERFRLLLHRNRWAYDSGVLVRYKVMNHMHYILGVSRLAPKPKPKSYKANKKKEQ